MNMEIIILGNKLLQSCNTLSRASLQDVHKAARLCGTLLENSQKTISQPPQRIIWCYGQWQPSYFDMMRMVPGIEFNQGIHDDIDNAD